MKLSTLDRRQVTGHRDKSERQEIGDRRWETGEGGETRDMRWEKRDGRKEMVDRRWEMGDKRWETGDVCKSGHTDQTHHI